MGLRPTCRVVENRRISPLTLDSVVWYGRDNTFGVKGNRDGIADNRKNRPSLYFTIVYLTGKLTALSKRGFARRGMAILAVEATDWKPVPRINGC